MFEKLKQYRTALGGKLDRAHDSLEDKTYYNKARYDFPESLDPEIRQQAIQREDAKTEEQVGKDAKMFTPMWIKALKTLLSPFDKE